MAELTAPAGPAGTLTIEDRVIERIATRAVLDIPGATRHQGTVGSLLGSTAGRSILGTDLPRTTLRSSGTALRISLDIALVWPCAVADVSRRTRDHVIDEVERLTGTRPVRVDVTVCQLVPRGEVQRRKSGFIDLPAPPEQPVSEGAVPS
ncbi:Asp23/Gls24 family envelope stress response protein [Gordonia metallireducens]|uniref:Asp23/Gls24 family envelope stress response protein n=1 Tax=Gordonia metallireducens TaxID=2897779 RepID=UPI001E51BE9A|nr:Asp23/Gls24 family envelope stress response protein [Gordonia metallireducens]